MVSTDPHTPNGHPVATTLRVFGRLLRLISTGTAGAALAITVLRSLGNGFEDLPGTAALVILALIAVAAFGVATLLMMIADYMAERAERHALEGPELTAEEREVERLRETPLLARNLARKRGTFPPDQS